MRTEGPVLLKRQRSRHSSLACSLGAVVCATPRALHPELVFNKGLPKELRSWSLYFIRDLHSHSRGEVRSSPFLSLPWLWLGTLRLTLGSIHQPARESGQGLPPQPHHITRRSALCWDTLWQCQGQDWAPGQRDERVWLQSVADSGLCRPVLPFQTCWVC